MLALLWIRAKTMVKDMGRTLSDPIQSVYIPIGRAASRPAGQPPGACVNLFHWLSVSTVAYYSYRGGLGPAAATAYRHGWSSTRVQRKSCQGRQLAPCDTYLHGSWDMDKQSSASCWNLSIIYHQACEWNLNTGSPVSHKPLANFLTCSWITQTLNIFEWTKVIYKSSHMRTNNCSTRTIVIRELTLG